MDDEKLIECVKAHTVLYNLDHEQYQDINLKNNIWRKIGIQLDQPSSLCKSRWNNIRDNLRKSMKKRRVYKKNGKQVRKYKYEDYLGFLISIKHSKQPLNQLVKTKIELDKSDEKYESHNEFEDDHSDESETYIDENEKIIVIEDRTDVTTSKTDRMEVLNELISPKKAYAVSSTTKVNCVPEAPVHISTNYVTDKSKSSRSDEVHPVDAFLAGLAPTLKSLTPYYLNLAKSKMFSIVQEFELEMLTEQGQANDTYFYKPEYDASTDME